MPTYLLTLCVLLIPAGVFAAGNSQRHDPNCAAPPIPTEPKCGLPEPTCQTPTPCPRPHPLPQAPVSPAPQGVFVQPPATGTVRGPVEQSGLEGASITLPELTLRLPSVRFPGFSRYRSNARMEVEGHAPYMQAPAAPAAAPVMAAPAAAPQTAAPVYTAPAAPVYAAPVAAPTYAAPLSAPPIYGAPAAAPVVQFSPPPQTYYALPQAAPPSYYTPPTTPTPPPAPPAAPVIPTPEAAPEPHCTSAALDTKLQRLEECERRLNNLIEVWRQTQQPPNGGSNSPANSSGPVGQPLRNGARHQGQPLKPVPTPQEELPTPKPGTGALTPRTFTRPASFVEEARQPIHEPQRIREPGYR